MTACVYSQLIAQEVSPYYPDENVSREKQEKVFLVNTYVSLTRKYLASGDMLRAYANFEKARMLDPDSVGEFEEDFYPGLNADAMLKKAKSSTFIQEKITYCQKALRMDEKHISARYYLATCFFKTKQYDDCIKELDIILDNEPQFRKAQRLKKKTRKKLAAMEASKPDA